MQPYEIKNRLSETPDESAVKKVQFAAYSLILVLGVIDFFTGFEVAFSLFYLIPIFFITWYVDAKNAVIAGVASAIVWQFSNFMAGETMSSYWIFLWNAAMRLAMYLLFSFLLLELKKLFENNITLSETDFLTKTVNSSAFTEMVNKEIQRNQRYGGDFTLVYIDIDHLNKINHKLGHSVGDKLLRKVAEVMRSNLRVTDIIGRPGGDEFAIFLPQTDEEQAKMVIRKIQDLLTAEMKKNNWEVTFSIGVITCEKPPDNADNLIEMGYDLMLVAKNNRNESIQYSSYVG
jgi:diguanylate cyclase (GGDEF)-like protein